MAKTSVKAQKTKEMAGNQETSENIEPPKKRKNADVERLRGQRRRGVNKINDALIDYDESNLGDLGFQDVMYSIRAFVLDEILAYSEKYPGRVNSEITEVISEFHTCRVCKEPQAPSDAVIVRLEFLWKRKHGFHIYCLDCFAEKRHEILSGND